MVYMHTYVITGQLTPQVLSRKKSCQVIKFSIKYFLARLHVETSSLRRLRDAITGLQIIKYFSQIHKLHLFDALLYDLARFKIFQVTG